MPRARWLMSANFRDRIGAERERFMLKVWWRMPTEPRFHQTLIASPTSGSARQPSQR